MMELERQQQCHHRLILLQKQRARSVVADELQDITVIKSTF